MRKYFVLALIALYQISFCQKPRYFLNSPNLCPFDYSVLAKKGGLESDPLTILITRDTLIERVKGLFNLQKDPVAESYKNVVIKDTFFKVTKKAQQFYAFDVVQQIGSFSVIQYWADEKKKELKNVESFYEIYKTYSSVAHELDVAFLPPQKGNYKLQLDGKKLQLDGKSEKEVNDTKDHYLIKTDDLNKYSKEFENKKNKWSMGFLILPVKFRAWADTSGQFEFSDGFSLGTAFSWTYKYKWINDKSYNLIFYTGISSISVDSLKTRGKAKSEKIAAFSPAIGLMIEKSGIQIGAFIGWDFPIGEIQKNWVYRNRPWIGIGLGFSILKFPNEENKDDKSNKPIK